ncbi:MAG: GUN4 domain-containing protein [Cyanobacteria bacterium P01_C01_bin.147]
MQRLILAGLLTGLAIASGPVPPRIAQSQSLPQSSETRYDIYLAVDQGLRFVYPEGYTIDSELFYGSLEAAAAEQRSWDIWRTSDYLPFGEQYSDATSAAGLPPHISIEIFPNPDNQPLQDWLESATDSSEVITVAEQGAIAYTAMGRYHSDGVLLNHPDGDVVKLQVEYTDAADPMRQVFQTVVASLVFDAMSETGAVAEVDYRRLQETLMAGDWQAANLETIAILMRLSSNYDYLYPYIESDDIAAIACADLQMLDTLWSRYSEGRYGFSAQQTIWRSLPDTEGKLRAEQLGQQLGWQHSAPPEADFISNALWRSDTELRYVADAPVGQFPWPGVTSLTIDSLIQNSGAGCGSCTIDALYIESDRLPDFLTVFMARVDECLCSDKSPEAL